MSIRADANILDQLSKLSFVAKVPHFFKQGDDHVTIYAKSMDNKAQWATKVST